MQKLFLQYIEEQALFTKTDKLLLAISGGIDSTVLGHLLYQTGYDFALAHCNFSLRAEESDGDQAFVESLAKQWGVPCFTTTFETKVLKRVGESTQMAARRLRYDWLEEVRLKGGYHYILTAHHIDDSIETFLLNFIRGTGLQGLTGIKASTGHIRRPILFASREQIEAYQKEHQVQFREDSSNASDKYRRNRIRHHVLPELYEINPSLAEVASRNFSHLLQSQALVEDAAKKWKEQICSIDAKGRIVFDRSVLQGLSFGPLLLWHWLAPYSFEPETIRQALHAKAGSYLEGLTHSLLVAQEDLVLESKPSEKDTLTWIINKDTHDVSLGEQHSLRVEVGNPPLAQLETPSSVARTPADLLVFPLQIRHWQSGDWFCPLGMKGQRQKLQDFFVNQKINQLDRREVLLLVNGNGEIIWVVNHRLDERYKITDRQSPYIEFEIVS